MSVNKIIAIGLILIISIFLFWILSPFTIIGAGQRGVITHFGKVQTEILDEGLHFVIPVVSSIHKLSVRVQKSQEQASAASKDIQLVTANFALNWHVDPSKVNNIFQNIGDLETVEANIIKPAVSEILKSATAKRTAEEILTKRQELKHEIDTMLIQRLKTYNVLIDDISLINLDFTAEFNKAVENKQIAEQRAKQAEYEAIQAEKQALANVNLAKGQAQAQSLLKQTITSEILQKMAIEKWDGKFPHVMAGDNLPMLNLRINN